MSVHTRENLYKRLVSLDENARTVPLKTIFTVVIGSTGLDPHVGVASSELSTVEGDGVGLDSETSAQRKGEEVTLECPFVK